MNNKLSNKIFAFRSSTEICFAKSQNSRRGGSFASQSTVINMKEIGGYFGFEQLPSNEYYSELLALNSGRNALLYLLEAKGISKLYLPFYLCSAVFDLCKGYVDYDFYHIDESFMPILEKELGQSEYLYIVNYFGQLSTESIDALKQKYRNVILDNSQSFFSRPINDIDTIYTCRKYFGVPDGAYLATESGISRSLECDVSGNRMKHVVGRFESNAYEYYPDYQEAELTFDHMPLRLMSGLTHNILGAIDYVSVERIRSNNYDYLDQKLGCLNMIKVNSCLGPFAYPFYCENGMYVKRELAKLKIYIPTLWPNVISKGDTIEKRYAENILPLPCDQRYTEEDMDYLLNCLLRFTN